MKIAVASDGMNVSAHFGHCEEFMVFESEKGLIKTESALKNPGHKPGFLPNFLNENGVQVIISGGMGGAAVDIFNSHNIEVVIGAAGTAKDMAVKYLKGELKSTGSVCHEHEHSDECH